MGIISKIVDTEEKIIQFVANVIVHVFIVFLGSMVLTLLADIAYWFGNSIVLPFWWYVFHPGNIL